MLTRFLQWLFRPAPAAVPPSRLPPLDNAQVSGFFIRTEVPDYIDENNMPRWRVDSVLAPATWLASEFISLAITAIAKEDWWALYNATSTAEECIDKLLRAELHDKHDPWGHDPIHPN